MAVVLIAAASLTVLLKLKINPAWVDLGGGVAGMVFGAVRQLECLLTGFQLMRRTI